MDECPNCARTARDALSSNWFWVYQCEDCEMEFCENCMDEGACPKCGCENYQNFEKVHAEEDSSGDEGDGGEEGGRENSDV